MKITKHEALVFFTALGFGKAGTWSAAKLKEKLGMVPAKVLKETVPEGQEEFYKNLCEAGDDIELVVEEGLSDKPDKKAKATKPAKKDKKPKEKQPKPAKEKKEPLAGSKIGSAVSSDWKNDDTIAKDAGIPLDQARSRLRHAVNRGLVEYRRLSQYRLLEPASKSKGE